LFRPRLSAVEAFKIAGAYHRKVCRSNKKIAAWQDGCVAREHTTASYRRHAARLFYIVVFVSLPNRMEHSSVKNADDGLPGVKRKTWCRS